MLNQDKIYLINPNYGIRNEKTKILIYEQDPTDGEIVKYNCFNPIYGIFLSLFDGKNTFKEIIQLYSHLIGSNSSFEDNAKGIDNYINLLESNFGPELFLDKNQIELTNVPEYDPINFIIDKNDIDLSNSRLSAPLSLNYDVTFKCPRNCIYCYAENNYAPRMTLLPLERVKEIIDEAKNIGVKYIILGGGDPFSRKEFIKLLSLIIENEIKYFVSTKSYLSEYVCKELQKIGMLRIQVSIDSANEKTADLMTGSKGYFKQIISSIKNLQNSGIAVRCKAIVTSLNFREIPNLLSFLDTLGIRTIQVTGYGMSMYRHSESLFITKEGERWLSERVNEFKDLHPHIKIIYGGFGSEYLTKEDKERAWKGRAKCSAGRSALNIIPNGKVSFCEQLPSTPDFIFGDLAKQSIFEAWNSDQLKELLLPDKNNFKGTPCFDCEEFIECNSGMGRCIRDSFNIFRSKYAPDPKCPRVIQPVKMS